MLLSNQAWQIRWREGLCACHVGVRVLNGHVEVSCVEWKGFLKVGFKVALKEKETGVNAISQEDSCLLVMLEGRCQAKARETFLRLR